MGPPGAGKSVQAEMLAERLGYQYISTGNLLRTENDPEIVAEMNKGEIIASEHIDSLLEERLTQCRAASGVVLDGYPRTLKEVDWISQKAPELGFVFKEVIFLSVPRDELVKRLMLRKRPDDTSASINRRLDEYEADTSPVVEHFRSIGELKEVDGVGAVEAIAGRIDQAL
jgi:adenylate kinase